jgi:molecular chaperone IbpA
MKMNRFDLTPLYRSTIGFERLASLFDTVHAAEKGTAFPPYNVERVDQNNYRLTMAVAGFGEDELDIEQRGGTLTVRGTRHADDSDKDATSYLYHGIAARNFERRFQLAKQVRVTGASLDKGLLHIEFEREIPEAERPRKIDIAKTLAA